MTINESIRNICNSVDTRSAKVLKRKSRLFIIHPR